MVKMSQSSLFAFTRFASKSCVLLYLQRYCAALEQWASAKLCGLEQGTDYELSLLVIFNRGRHL